MSVNQNIYGSSSQWQRYPYDSAWSAVDDINECIRVAYFGNYEPRYQTLAKGAENDKIDKSVPLDKSLSYCGLGTESAYSHVKYYSNATLEPLTNGDTITPFFTDSRTITNFAFMYGDIANGSGYGNSGGRYNTTDAACRYYPDADVEYDYNNNRALTPITSFKFTNFILLIRVKCCRGLDPSNSYYFNPENGEDFTLYDYVNTSAHSDYPYVYCVYVVPYCYSSDATKRTPYPNVQRGQGIAILDSFDGATNSNLKQPLYSYYYGQTSYSDPAFKIHGMLTGGGTQQSMQYHASAEETELGYLAICPDTWTAFKYRTYGSYICMGVWREYDNTFWDECMTAVACFGCFFTDKIEIAQSGDLTDTDMYCGTLVDGIGHGDYTHGADNANQPQFSATTNDIGYDPSNPPEIDPNEYDEDNRSVLRNPLYAQIGGHTYITTGNNFQGAYNHVMKTLEDAIGQLQAAEEGALLARQVADADPRDEDKALTATNKEAIAAIYKQQANTFTDAYRGIHANPINSVKSILAFPFDLRPYISSSAQNYMRWGLWDVSGKDESASGDFNLVTGTTSQFWVPGGECTYFAEYKNFLDYSPYCSAELYIPYCGSVSIDPETFIGHKISVRYLVDWHTGACLALVYRDDLIVEQISGQIAISIPLIAADELSYANSMFQGQQAVKNAQTGAVATTVSGLANGFVQGAKMAVAPLPTNIASGLASITQSAAAMATSYNNVKSAEYELATKQLSYKQLTTATPMTSTGNEQECRLVIYRPTFIDKYTKNNFGTYGHTTGFACLKNESLENYTGLTVCSSVDLSGIGQATEKEKEMIERALKTGVYL